jgi:hypothetical protein
MRFERLASLAITLALIMANVLGLPEALGAHPLWVVKTGGIGSLGGLGMYAAL